MADISRFIVWGDKPEQIGTGGFGNVYKCSMSGQPVAVKVLRARSYINECDGPEEHALTALKRRIEREKRSWKSLEHPNVLELLGVCFKPELSDQYRLPCFVSPWMNGGTARNYIKQNPDVDFLNFILGIASGVRCLHRHQVVHGDIRGANVLVEVDDSGTVIPKLSDFGMARILKLNVNDMTVTQNWNNGGHWSPPEYVDYNDKTLYVGPEHPTKEGDIWMYSMTVLELYGNQCPYAGLGTPAVTLAISRKELPKIPDPQHDSFAIYDSFVRSLCTGDWCWNPNPKERPSMAAIVDFLNEGDDTILSDVDEEAADHHASVTRRLRERQRSYSSVLSSPAENQGSRETTPTSMSSSEVGRQPQLGVRSFDYARSDAAQNIYFPPSFQVKTEPEEYQLGSQRLHQSPTSVFTPPPSPHSYETHGGAISHMTVLNNYASKSGKRLTTSEEMNGYAHAPSWLVEVMFDGRIYGKGKHSKKKKAQDIAAKETLDMLRTSGQNRDLHQCLPAYRPIFESYLRDIGLSYAVEWSDPVPTGPAHAPYWTCSVTMNGREIGRATESKKELAMEEAAKAAALSFPDWPYA